MALVYLDDVIVYSKTIKEHFQHFEEILDTIKSAGISLKLQKCAFYTDTVKYLGNIIHHGTFDVDVTDTAALKGAKHPTTQTQLRPFLGL